MEKLVSVAENEGRYVGPAFATANGKLASSCDYDAVFRMYLKKVQATTDLIPDDVNVDVYYSLSRTPRKSALTWARRANSKPWHQTLGCHESLEDSGNSSGQTFAIQYATTLL